MSSFATRRLIDAASALPPAERAQLNLWVNRGLDDPALARMTGMTLEAIAARRERIVGHLSEELGLPPDQILGALADIAASSFVEDLPTPSNGQASAVSPAEDSPAESVAKPAAESAAEPESAPLNGHGGAAQVASAPAGLLGPDGDGPPAPERRRLGLRAAIGGLLVLVGVILIAVLAFGSGSSSPPGRSTRTGARSPTTTTAGAPHPHTSASPPPTLSRPPEQQPLSALPGGTNHATGSVTAIGNRHHLSLRLTVRKLTPAVHGHYEVWLYNSIIDSAPLGRLRASVADVSLRLPAGAHRYRWIDVSFQPVGMVFNSGESVLRATNPAAASRSQLRKRSFRHRTLRRASSGSRRTKTSK